MDYIFRLIDRKLNYFQTLGRDRDTAEYYRVKVEYAFILIMAYLWNQNLNLLDSDDKEYIFRKINMPSIGSIVEIARKLDINKNFFNNKRLNEAINNYPKLRNERLGHGFVFEDGLEDYLNALKSIWQAIYESTSFLKDNFDIVVVTDTNNGSYKGISFKPDGQNFVPWACPSQVFQFDIGGVYLFSENSKYFRISPFVHATLDEEFYVFKNMEENLTGKVRYNQLIRTGNTSIEWEELSNISIENSDFRRKSINGTIISTIDKNYKRYIEIGILKKKVINFLLRDRASVCATIWGHGGVGKTATVQSICEDLANDPNKRFDYIVFASAKDRFYNYYTGDIETIEENIDSFDGLIRSINRVIYGNENSNPALIVENSNRILIVIDDYETFPIDEKQKIEEFIRTLDINHHKVLITTRANLIVGDEFQTNELDQEETKSFLLEILRSEFEDYDISTYESDLVSEDKYKLVHEVTNGRPLFVYQFAYIWVQVGKIEEALRRKIKQEKTAIDFLYGRIYDYLSPTAKDVFVAIGQIVSDEDPTNLIEKVRYILNLENSEKFDNAIKELEKLRIIEIIDTKFFRVYSREILHSMSSYFSNRNDSFRRSLISRIQEVTRDKKLDNEQALLANANAARTSRHEEEVIRLYRSILNRETSPSGVKLQAILNFGEYLFNYRGKRDEAIKLFKDYEHLFASEPNFSRMYAIYCWSSGRNEEGIQILRDLFSRKPSELSTNKSLRIELLGLLLMYRGINAIQQREELKERRKFNEIELLEYQREYDQTKELFADICDTQGRFLIGELRKIDDLSMLSSGARQNSVSGLYQYVNLSIRLNKYIDGVQICEYVIQNYPSHFYEPFKSKLDYCRRKLEERQNRYW